MAYGQSAGKPRVVSDDDKRLSADWLKRIDAAKERHKAAFKQMEKCRILLRGRLPEDQTKKLRTNLFFANLASMRPQVYSKDPEFAVTPSPGVPRERLAAVQVFCETSEALLSQKLVKGCSLKKRSKRLLTSAYTTSVGWLKVTWQEDGNAGPLSENSIKSLQDNLARLREQRQAATDPALCQNADLEIAKAEQTLAGIKEGPSETVSARGLVADFVLPEDLLILDPSVLEFEQYLRSSAMAHRVYMTRQKYAQAFGYECSKGKSYSEKDGQRTEQGGADKRTSLLAVWEIWDQDSNRVFCVCEGEEGFCAAPYTPDWAGKRWYPFFGLAFNEIDATFYPLSDVELTEQVVREYNENRDDLVQDRKDGRPFTVVREGGNLSEEDVKKIRNRDGNDVIVIKGVGNQPLSNDMQAVTLGQINQALYDTGPARADMEQLVGGGDASRGTVLKAKTATEAEILSQGLRSRSGERQDTMEDLLSEIGEYSLQIFLRKLTPQEVSEACGPEAATNWPRLSADQVFRLVSVGVRAGSTGKPDRLQEQDRWTKLLPVIEKTMERVASLRAEGHNELAQAVIELTRETLRRFEERLDIDQFLPPPEKGDEKPAGPDPAQMQQVVEQGKAMIQELQAQVADLQKQLDDKAAEIDADIEKARIAAAASVESAERVARIKGEADAEVARITATGKVMEAVHAPAPTDPAELHEPLG